MATTGQSRVSVLLVGLPGLLEGVLRRELRDDPTLVVRRMAGEESGPRTYSLDSVVVVGADAASLREAASLLDRGIHVLATIAVTGEQPIGDMYLISPAGKNVSPAELAQAIRDAAAAARPRPIEARILN